MTKPPVPLIATLILFLFMLASYPLALRLISQLYYQKAENNIQDGYYLPAIEDLEKAIRFWADDSLIWKKLGMAYHKLGESRPIKDAFPIAIKARQAYNRAAGLNPLDVETAYGLALEEAWLEYLYPYLYPAQRDNPYDALPFFQEAIRLRPNGLSNQYAFARHLYHQSKTDEFLKVISNLSRIYPSIYNHFKKDPFWSPAVREAVKKGIRQAIDQGIDLRNAHKIISSLLAEEKDWSGAISHLQKAFEYQAFLNNSEDYFRLGRLYLENGQLKEAKRCFVEGLTMSQNREKDLGGLFGFYQKKGYTEELFQFYDQVKSRFPLSYKMDILLARSLMNLKRYHKASRILNELNDKEPSAEAYYWLARIADQEKDPNKTELAIQKATVLDPRNSRYHLFFSQVLARINKLDGAEKEAGLAIRYSDKPSSGLFIHRAQIRWRKKDYSGAAEDWESAIALDPDNKEYQKRYDALRKKQLQ